MPETDRSPSTSSSTVVYIKLPSDLIEWMDMHLAELRIALLRAGKRHIPAPTRSSFMRDLVLRAKNNGSK